MRAATDDRRVARRRDFIAPLRVRVWRSAVPEWSAESKNLSETGIFFATNSALRVGMAVEVFLNMPKEITGEPATEWLYTGHIVRVEPVDSPQGRLGVGVQFDCYEFARAK
jgi:Tfp pilus assembly protein PilZ